MSMESIERILVIAAHPDDEILGCGGTISKISNEFDISVLILSLGAQGRYPDSMETTLRENAEEANRIVGTKALIVENFPNQEMDNIPLTRIIENIEKHIEEQRSTIVFTHHSGDLNKDHRIVYEATMTAVRPIAGQNIKKVYCYNVPSSTEWNSVTGEHLFVPNTYIDIKETLQTKIEALKEYRSECRPYPHPRSSESIKAHAHYWGLTVGYEYAEPFHLVRNISNVI
jgi:LmbE family N-acetylglucosaminyl deacetylase